MGFRFSTPRIGGFLLLVLLSSCTGLSTKDHPPLVFALNLSSVSVSLSLVKGDERLADFPEVGPMESRPLMLVPANDAVMLRRATGIEPGEDWTDPSGTPYSLRFQTGHLYAIVVDPRGQAAVYSLPENYSSDPKLCIVNAATQTLSQVQAAPDWAKNIKVYAQDIVPVVPSEFYSFEPKTLGLYWQTLDQVAEGAHTVARDQEGKPLRPEFVKGRYYLFLAGEGSLRDLTPSLD